MVALCWLLCGNACLLFVGSWVLFGNGWCVPFVLRCLMIVACSLMCVVVCNVLLGVRCSVCVDCRVMSCVVCYVMFGTVCCFLCVGCNVLLDVASRSLLSDVNWLLSVVC